MKREAKALLNKGLDSLILGIEHFSRPSNRGRTTTVLILLDHSFEMLFKACIVTRDGKIGSSGSPETIGFDHCVRIALSDANIKFLIDEQAIGVRAINSLRDAAQHYLVQVSEQQLYMHAQAAVTLFREVLEDVFHSHLGSFLPERVLPISTVAPTDLDVMFDKETSEIKKLLQPGKRKTSESYARLRALAILESSTQGENTQPTLSELRELATKLKQGVHWHTVFPGVASIQVTEEGSGPEISLRFAKKRERLSLLSPRIPQRFP